MTVLAVAMLTACNGYDYHEVTWQSQAPMVVTATSGGETIISGTEVREGEDVVFSFTGVPVNMVVHARIGSGESIAIQLTDWRWTLTNVTAERRSISFELVEIEEYNLTIDSTTDVSYAGNFTHRVFRHISNTPFNPSADVAFVGEVLRVEWDLIQDWDINVYLGVGVVFTRVPVQELVFEGGVGSFVFPMTVGGVNLRFSTESLEVHQVFDRIISAFSASGWYYINHVGANNDTRYLQFGNRRHWNPDTNSYEVFASTVSANINLHATVGGAINELNHWYQMGAGTVLRLDRVVVMSGTEECSTLVDLIGEFFMGAHPSVPRVIDFNMAIMTSHLFDNLHEMNHLLIAQDIRVIEVYRAAMDTSRTISVYHDLAQDPHNPGEHRIEMFHVRVYATPQIAESNTGANEQRRLNVVFRGADEELIDVFFMNFLHRFLRDGEVRQVSYRVEGDTTGFRFMFFIDVWQESPLDFDSALNSYVAPQHVDIGAFWIIYAGYIVTSITGVELDATPRFREFYTHGGVWETYFFVPNHNVELVFTVEYVGVNTPIAISINFHEQNPPTSGINVFIRLYRGGNFVTELTDGANVFLGDVLVFQYFAVNESYQIMPFVNGYVSHRFTDPGGSGTVNGFIVLPGINQIEIYFLVHYLGAVSVNLTTTLDNSNIMIFFPGEGRRVNHGALVLRGAIVNVAIRGIPGGHEAQVWVNGVQKELLPARVYDHLGEFFGDFASENIIVPEAGEFNIEVRLIHVDTSYVHISHPGRSGTFFGPINRSNVPAHLAANIFVQSGEKWTFAWSSDFEPAGYRAIFYVNGVEQETIVGGRSTAAMFPSGQYHFSFTTGVIENIITYRFVPRVFDSLIPFTITNNIEGFQSSALLQGIRAGSSANEQITGNYLPDYFVRVRLSIFISANNNNSFAIPMGYTFEVRVNGEIQPVDSWNPHVFMICVRAAGCGCNPGLAVDLAYLNIEINLVRI